MNARPEPDAYGELIEPGTLRIERLLPGPIERVWDYLTDGELRRQWLASGKMDAKIGARFELVWRNDELTDPPGPRPDGFPEEHRMQSRVTVCEPPHRLAFTWDDSGEVSFELAVQGDRVRLTLIHRGLPDRNTKLMVGAGWHAHLDILVARARGERPAPFWEDWTRLRGEYDERIDA